MSTFCCRFHGRLFLTLLFIGFLTSSARGTSVPRLSWDQLVNESDCVVTGVVSNVRAEWDADHKLIWTRSEITVQQTHKGRPGTTVVVSEPGGEIDGRGMFVAGTVRYGIGDCVLVFLKSYPGLGYRTHGWGQGKYKLDGKGRLHADDSLGSVELTSLSNLKKGRPNQLDGLALVEASARIATQVRSGGSK